jgi:hypothetical protein
MKTTKNIVLSVVTIVMLLLQLMSPALVRAKGETPAPPLDTPSETTTPLIKPTLTDISPTETPTLDALSPTATDLSSLTPTAPASQTSNPTESSTPTQKPSDERPSGTAEATHLPPDLTETALPKEVVAIEHPTLLESVQTMSKDTNVVVLDANGQPVPLASQDAAQAIINIDPVWCPAGQAPTPGANGCTVFYLTLADLVAYEGAGIAADGTIWMTSGPVSDLSNITIDGSTYTTWSNYTLTLQGGWSGIAGDTIIGPNSMFTVPITIWNWNNNITINNIHVENTTFDPNVYTGYAAGLTVVSTYGSGSDITINNSNFNNNNYGALIGASGSLLVNNSSFNNNNDTGAWLEAENLTIDNSSFNNNGNDGAHLVANNLTIDNSSFNNNGYDSCFGCSGITYFGSMNTGQISNGNVNISSSVFINNNVAGIQIQSYIADLNFVLNYNFTINNSNFSNNGFGAVLDIANGNITINNGNFSGNSVGLGTGLCRGNIVLNNVTFSGNTNDIASWVNCHVTIINPSIISSQSEGEFALDCISVDGYSINLPNGDLVQIFCPVSGRARISRLDNTALPAALPASYTYASAFSLDILQNSIPIPVITEGGFIKVSFVASSLQTGSTYSVLYWDNGTWVPLKDFMLEENGNVQDFDLNPGAPEDIRKIMSGVKLVTVNGSPRVEVSTNFPGIFVLAQH